MTAHSPSNSSVKTYLLVFLGLAILTGLTVSISYMHLAHRLAVALAFVISLAKCALIAAFFMHLKSEKLGVMAFLFVGLIFVAVLIAAVVPDIGLIN